jgi:signal transduction histidine kinase/ligand-binding sensor domain-containing protein
MFVSPGVTWAADPFWQVDTWNVEKGLPHNTVTALAQTGDSFLWVGTENGLARFDGHQFRVFTPQNTPALGSGRVRVLCGETGGRLWVSTAEPMLACLKSGQATLVASAEALNSARVVSLASDGSGALWWANERGVAGRVDGGVLCPVATNFSAADNHPRLFHIPADEVWLAHGGGLDRLRPGEAERMVVLSGAPLGFAAPGRAGWWLGTGAALRWWDGTNEIREIAFPTNVLASARTALEDRTSNLWIGTELHGVWCRTPEGVVRTFATTNGLASDSVRCMFEDRGGSIWVGTEGGGLNRLRPRLFHMLAESAGLNGEPATAVCEGPGGEIWVGTDRGTLKRLRGGGAETVGKVSAPPARKIRSLGFDSTQRLWIGTQDHGLFFLQDDEWRPFTALWGVPQVAAIFEDARWGLWLGVGASNVFFRIIGDAPQAFPVPLAGPGLDVRVFADDGVGGLWFGTQGNGLYHWDGRDFRRYRREDGLRSDTVWSLLLDPEDHALWIGTEGGGLGRFKEGRIQMCGKPEGLHDNQVAQILDDHAGWLWCSSQHGIFRIPKPELRELFAGQIPKVHSVAYGVGDGLASVECAGGSQPAGCRSRDGRLWWPTAKGVAWVDPSRVPTDPVPPKVVLDEMLVDEQPVGLPDRADSGPEGLSRPAGRVVIGPGVHRVEFRYGALSWPAPEFVRFRHRLEGVDHDWIEAGGDRAVHYNSLPPGDYRFWVMAANRDGVWSPAGAPIAFRLQPRVWQTWWFQLAAIGAFAGGLATLAVWWNRQRARARLEVLERLHAVEQERARIAQDIHDDLGASLTQIALLSELAQSQIEQPQVARGHLDLIFNNARNLVRATDEIVWALHPKNSAVELSLNFITRFAQEYLRVAGVPCRLDFPVELPNALLPSATRHHLYLAVKEALNNVVKHAAATEVWLRLTCEGNHLVLSVEDNGRGFVPGQRAAPAGGQPSPRCGHGLQGMDRRMRAVSGRFEQTSALGKGTLTRFYVPLQS